MNYKKIITFFILVVILGLAVWFFSRQPTPIDTNIPPQQPATTTEQTTTQTYASSTLGISIKLPQGYTTDESYVYQASPSQKFSGVKFTIPASVSQGTNLGSDSYISVESIPNSKTCTANLFFDGVHSVGLVATSSGAGAGNRYEETVYAQEGTNPCLAVRYFIHYGAIQNYPAGTVKEFDQAALINQFDAIRKTLTIVQ